MKKYNSIKTLGEGTFAIVQKAQNQQTGEIVAIKQMKQSYRNWEECLKLRELKALQKLKDHPNIIKLREIVQVDDKLNFIFEYVETNVWEYYNEHKKTGKPLSNDKIKSIFYQVASAIKYMHQQQFFHRDLKPENILISKNGVIKLIDFGLAREIRSRPPFTDYVATRWYRAPELLLRSVQYNSPVDIFALGLIMAELYEGKPLFQGTSEIDQLLKLCGILGTPTKDEWPDGYILANQRGFNFRNVKAIPLDQVLTNTPYEAIQLIQQMLRWDPQKRPNITKILSDPFFNDVQNVLPQEIGGKRNSMTEIPQQIQPIQQQEETKQEEPIQKQKQGNKMQQRKSINLDEIDDMLQEVEKKEKEMQQSSGITKFGSSNLDNSSSKKNIPSYHANSNPGIFDYNTNKDMYQQSQYAKDRTNRPNSLQGVHTLNFKQGQEQQQQSGMGHHQNQSSSYSPEKKNKYQYQSGLNDKNDDILKSILNSNNDKNGDSMFSNDYKF